MDKDYKYIAFDAQYFLHRNFAALKSRTAYDMASYLTKEEGDPTIGHIITKYEFTDMDLVKQFFWTIAKFIREQYTCSKIILLWDKPPYHKTKILPDYKGSRIHHCQELLDEWDIEKDPIGYLQEKEEYRVEKIKSSAKYYIINKLKDYGMISVIEDGYEADDLAWIFSHLDEIENSDQKSAICSVDSDWHYWISKNVDYLHFNNGEVWTYDDVENDCDRLPEKLGLSIFEAKKYMDSLFYSHNDLKQVTNCGWSDFERLVTEIRNGDYHEILDKDTYDKNMKSFEIDGYPEYDKAVIDLTNSLHNGILMGVDDFCKEAARSGLNVSRSYYKDKFYSYLDENYYGGY